MTLDDLAPARLGFTAAAHEVGNDMSYKLKVKLDDNNFSSHI